MQIDLSAFHFLRPLWLLLMIPGLLLPVLWARRHDLSRRLEGVIAPHLLAHLVIPPEHEQPVRAIHLFAAILIVGGVAAAGPTWQQDRPDFLENRAPLVIALDLSKSMDADDLQPSRLGAARQKMHDLIQRRAGARTALIAYAATAHLVMPPTEDPALLDTYLQALSSDLITGTGKDVAGVIDEAKRLLGPDTPGTLLLVTDGADARQFSMIKQRLAGSDLQVLVMAAGMKNGAVISGPDGQVRRDENGRPLLARFDSGELRQLAQAADAPLGSLILNHDDLDWIELHAQRHFQAASDDTNILHWKDAGYWLCWPVLLLALLAIRRGWRIHWFSVLLVSSGVGALAPSAYAGPVADAFFTPDQQGRWAFEHQHYPQAAKLFSDPYWRGMAAYQAADFPEALASFAQLDTAPAHFYLGNSYVRLSRFPEAIAAYEHALKLQPEFPQATANLALAQALLKDREDQQQAGPPNEKPDEVKFDNTNKGGKQIQSKVRTANSDQQWLDNLTTSPAMFLKQKFSLQSETSKELP
jgi:Ca-activated chloride channel family protein